MNLKNIKYIIGGGGDITIHVWEMVDFILFLFLVYCHVLEARIWISIKSLEIFEEKEGDNIYI